MIHSSFDPETLAGPLLSLLLGIREYRPCLQGVHRRVAADRETGVSSSERQGCAGGRPWCWEAEQVWVPTLEEGWSEKTPGGRTASPEAGGMRP